MRLISKFYSIIERKYRILLAVFFIVFLAIGLFSLNSYGIAWDEINQQILGNSAIKLLLSNNRVMFDLPNKFHGTSFTIIMTIIERSFNITSLRAVYLMRHYCTFLVFYLSVVCFYFLCRNIFKSWKIGLLGSIFLVLTPRIFADSFYNPKDLPFLSFFIISMFTLNMFISKRTVKSAVIHAIATGFAAGIRILGILIPFFTILLLISEIIQQRKQNKDIRRINAGRATKNYLIYLLITIPIFLFLMPSLLPDPIGNFFATIKTMSDFPHNSLVLYMGRNLSSTNLPWHYLPVNILISTPAFYIVLFLAGFACFFYNFTKRPFIIGDDKKYTGIALLWFFIPLLGVIILKSTLYGGWRHMYFIYPAFLIIALGSIKAAFNFFKNKLNPVKYIVTSFILTIIIFLNLVYIVQIMIRLHPYEYIYYNAFAGSNLGEVKEKYPLDYWGISFKTGLEYILKTDSRDKITYTMRCGPSESSEFIFTKADRDRLVYVTDISKADYFLNNYRCSDLVLEEQGVNIVSLNNNIFNLTINGGNILSVYKLK